MALYDGVTIPQPCNLWIFPPKKFLGHGIRECVHLMNKPGFAGQGAKTKKKTDMILAFIYIGTQQLLVGMSLVVCIFQASYGASLAAVNI